MSSYGENFEAETVKCDVLYWKSFEPPLTGSGPGPGVPTIANVLDAGDDANDEDLLNINNLTTKTAALSATLSVAGTTTTNGIVNTGAIDTGTLAVNTISAVTSISAPDITATNSISSNQFKGIGVNPSVQDMNLIDTNTAEVATNLNAGSASCTLGATTMDGILDMNNKNLVNGNLISTAGLSATSIVEAPVVSATGLCQVQGLLSLQANDTIINFPDNATGTKIEGAATTRTVCDNLDFVNGTGNLFPATATEQYEWMSVWTNAITNFPPPDGWKTYDPPQLPPINLVVFDFDEDRNTGWRYFAPQSDSDCQIDPDDKMELNEGEYIHAPDNNLAWKYAFYGTTAATTVASHASQIVEFTFPVVQYGYGRIYMGLAVQPPPYTALPIILNETFRLVMEHEGGGGIGATNPRLNGPTTMKWYVPDAFPTDGTQWRVYPMCRTDDTETTEGRLQIKIGNGQPLDGCNPGDPPEFDPENTNSQQGQLLLRGYPIPAEFLGFTNPPGQI